MLFSFDHNNIASQLVTTTPQLAMDLPGYGSSIQSTGNYLSTPFGYVNTHDKHIMANLTKFRFHLNNYMNLRSLLILTEYPLHITLNGSQQII